MAATQGNQLGGAKRRKKESRRFLVARPQSIQLISLSLGTRRCCCPVCVRRNSIASQHHRYALRQHQGGQEGWRACRRRSPSTLGLLAGPSAPQFQLKFVIAAVAVCSRRWPRLCLELYDTRSHRVKTIVAGDES